MVFGDQNILVETKSYPHGKFFFEKFNPVQSRLFEFYNQDCNAIVASVTASGKTVIAEMVLAYEIRTKKKTKINDGLSY